MTIGKVYEINGKPVYITGGQYYGDYNRVSNFWEGHYIRKDGSLGKKWNGYGRSEFKQLKAKLRVIVTP